MEQNRFAMSKLSCYWLCNYLNFHFIFNYKFIVLPKRLFVNVFFAIGMKKFFMKTIAQNTNCQKLIKGAILYEKTIEKHTFLRRSEIVNVI